MLVATIVDIEAAARPIGVEDADFDQSVLSL
jgi:hypothetical protein